MAHHERPYDGAVEWPGAREAADRLRAAMAGDADKAVRRWADSGGLHLTGRADGPRAVQPARVALAFDEWAAQVAERTGRLGQAVHVDGAALIGERAALTRLARRGAVSCGGACHLMAAADGWIALSLARIDDIELLDAWLGEPLPPAAADVADPEVPLPDRVWAAIEAAVATRACADLVARASLLGLPCSAVGERGPERPLFAVEHAERGPAKRLAEITVVDLSSLWAGPLCTNLLGLGGARVVKVEGLTRPDGARSGPPAFFELLHHGHEQVSLDLRSAPGRRQLAALIRSADVVVEASRPRALEAMGLSFATMQADGWQGVWLSITGHGHHGDDAARVAFGDDAAAAGGLVVSDTANAAGAVGDTSDTGGPLFCADAIADPASGLLAATAVLDALADGVACRLGVALADTAAHLAAGVRDNPPVASWPGLEAAAPRAREVPR